MPNQRKRPKPETSNSNQTNPITTTPDRTAATDPSALIDDYAKERVEYHVGRVGRSYRLNHHDQDDLRQAIFTAICAAARRYDPRRSKPRTYVCRVIELAVAHFKRCIRNERRCPARSPILLSQLQREGRCFAPLAPRSCEPAAHDLVLDMRQGLAAMNTRRQRLAESMKNESAAEIASGRGVHRSTVYRDIAAMRGKLSDLGLDPSS